MNKAYSYKVVFFGGVVTLSDLLGDSSNADDVENEGTYSLHHLTQTTLKPQAVTV